MDTEAGTPPSLNQALAQLDVAALSALFADVPVSSLRHIAKSGAVGKELRRYEFAGFRVDVLGRSELLTRFERAIRLRKGEEPAHSLLHAWAEAHPGVEAIALETMNRKDPFAGPVTAPFLERMAEVVPEESVAAIRRVVRIVDPNQAGAPDAGGRVAASQDDAPL